MSHMSIDCDLLDPLFCGFDGNSRAKDNFQANKKGAKLVR